VSHEDRDMKSHVPRQFRDKTRISRLLHHW